MTLKNLTTTAAFFLLLTTSVTNLQAQERGIEINSKRNADKSVDFTYEKILAMTALDIALNDFIWKILPGLFFTIIISIILRRTKL